VRRLNRGFSMIELMVAVVLGLLVTGAIISVFAGSRSAYQSTSGVAALADSGRFALDTMEESSRGAGYVACNHATPVTSASVLNEISSPLAYDFRYGVGGYEAAGTGPGGAVGLPAIPVAGAGAGNWTPNLDATFTGATNQQVLASDVLVLRSNVPRVTPAYTTADVGVGAGSFQVANAGALQAGQLAVISDCTKSVAFQISNVAGGTPATVHFDGATGAPGNASISLPMAFSAGAVVSPLTTTVYYIGVGADGDSALRRLDLLNGLVGATVFTDQEVVPDVENMQILYGVDTNNTQMASAYVTADQVLTINPGVIDFSNVVSVKIAVLSASATGAAPIPAAAPTFTLLGTTVTAPRDTRLRKVFEATITLRNTVR